MSVRTSVAPLILLAVASWALAQDPAATAKKGGSARWTQGTGTLPNRHGQVWREYDISPYTDRAGDGAKPEQAGVDWILRDTGTQARFSQVQVRPAGGQFPSTPAGAATAVIRSDHPEIR